MKLQLFEITVAGFDGCTFRAWGESGEKADIKVHRFLGTLRPSRSIRPAAPKTNDHVRENEILPYTGASDAR